MANKAYSLAHTKWMCKYHIVFTPKYRRKVIYGQYRENLKRIFRPLCKYKYVSTVGLNEETIRKYIRDREKKDIAMDRLSVKKYEDPFK